MFRIAICDDNTTQIELVLNLIKKYKASRPGLEIHTIKFRSGSGLLNATESGQELGLLIFDVQMPDMGGIELARELRLRGDDIPLVLLASSTAHAYDAFCVDAAGYILKPVAEEEFFSVLDKVVAKQGHAQDKYLLFPTPKCISKVLFSTIVCVESINRTLRVYLANGTKLESKTIRVPFTTAIAPLLEDARFLQAHKSFVLNMDWVKEISGNSIVMKEGIEVPIPRNKHSDVKARYIDYAANLIL